MTQKGRLGALCCRCQSSYNLSKVETIRIGGKTKVPAYYDHCIHTHSQQAEEKKRRKEEKKKRRKEEH